MRKRKYYRIACSMDKLDSFSYFVLFLDFCFRYAYVHICILHSNLKSTVMKDHCINV